MIQKGNKARHSWVQPERKNIEILTADLSNRSLKVDHSI